MEKIALVSAPIISELTELASIEQLLRKHPIYNSPQLGILSVATLFKQQGWDVQLYEINRYYANFIASGGLAIDFSYHFSSILLNDGATHYGFSSICSSYYLTLKIAMRIKELRNETVVILGGPQATATAKDTLSLFPSIDFILSGEIELSIADFVAKHSNSPESIPGLWFKREDSIVYNGYPPLPNSNDFVTPSYDLWDMSEIYSIPIEGGRGCPFSCKFCSTNGFFRRSYRIKSLQHLFADIEDVVKKYSVGSVSFVHDNLFISKRACNEFCTTWRSSESLKVLKWTCSMRIGVIDCEVAEQLRLSNCAGVFIGIESGSDRIQKIINKNIDIAEALHTISILNYNGIHSTAAFIVGFPEETAEDLKATLRVYSEALRIPLCKPQVASFAILAGSNYANNKYKFDGEISTLSHQGPPIDTQYSEYLRKYPEIFSAHHRPVLEYLNNEFIGETEYFLNYSYSIYRWLLALLSIAFDDGLYYLIYQWIEYKQKKHPQKGNLYEYYSSRKFHYHFIEFLNNQNVFSKFPTAIARN